MRSTFEVLFYVKKGSEERGGNLPLMCRIPVDGEIKNCAALWGSMKGRPQRSSRESRWNMQGNSTRRNTDGNSRPKRLVSKW